MLLPLVLLALTQAHAGAPCATPAPRPSSRPLVRVPLDPGTTGAVCNDGSWPVLYVRPASGAVPGSEGRFLVYLMGGANCSEVEACDLRARRKPWLMGTGCDASGCDLGRGAWAGVPGGGWPPTLGNGLFDLGVATELGGILRADDPGDGTPFHAWNHVVVDYCSSDNWAGHDGTLTLSGGASLTAYEHLSSSPGQPSDLVEFRGARIVELVFEALSAGLPLPDGSVLPTLLDASEVLFVGTSAGSRGVQQHATRQRDRLVDLGFSGRFGAVLDAGVFAYDVVTDPNDPWASGACSAQVWPSGGLADQTIPGKEGFLTWRPHLDDACLAAFDVAPGDFADFHAAPCLTVNRLLQGAFEVPYFFYTNLTDDVVNNALQTLGPPPGLPTPDTEEAYQCQQDIVSSVTKALRGLPDAAPGGGFVTCLREDRSYPFPLCDLGASSGVGARAHGGIHRDALFYGDVRSSDGTRAQQLTASRTLWNWWQGAGPSWVVTDRCDP